jgi:hypothetical protein
MLDVLRLAAHPGRVGEILELFGQTRPQAEAFRVRLRDSPTMIPALDPLFPAIVRAVAYWGAAAAPVRIVHDRQNTFSEGRIARLKEISGARLASLRLVGSFSDPRVQLADVLAGTARKIASDELNDRGDEYLTTLLRPYVDSFSVWGDGRSWSELAPR